MAIYVDDILMTGSWEEEIASLQQHMLSRFTGTIKQNPDSFLGLEIRQDGKNCVIHQTEYCKSIIRMAFKEPTKWVSTPLAAGSDLTSRKEEENHLDLMEYRFRQILGKLMYLAHMTRPDISNAVRELGQQMNDPCMRHWRGIQHLLRYLGMRPNLGIPIEKEQNKSCLNLKGYADADYAADPETRKSCAGYMVFLGKTMITWSSKIEKSIVLSTTESEWTALVRGIKHANFLRGMMEELGFKQSTIPWFCDNQATIKTARTMGFNGRTKHVDVKLKFTRQKCEQGLVTLKYLPTDHQLADVLTKRLRKVKHNRFLSTALVYISTLEA